MNQPPASSDPRDNPYAHTPLTETGGAVQPPADSLAGRYPWAVFILPFAVYMVANSLEPAPDKPLNLGIVSVDYANYPIVYTVKLALVVATMLALLPGYRQFRCRVSPLAVVIGAVGVVVWIGLCKLQIEQAVLGPLGLDSVLGLGERAAYNPLEQLADRPALAYGFLAVRFLGLAAIVPVIEEFFLRGCVMPYFVQPDWWRVPFGTVNRAALAAGVIAPVLLHPAEMVAAAAWFSMVTWLMLRTRNIWDCVAAHAVTNLLLGVYVVTTGEWQFM